jgi:hypothetical protein
VAIDCETMGQYFSGASQHVADGVHIGHVGSARDEDALRERGIRNVVDLSNKHYTPVKGVRVLRIDAPDVPDFDIRVIFARTNGFIRGCVERGEPVLVHCAWGVSRSAAVVIAYLMAFKRLSLREATALLRAARPCVRPNVGFRRYLRAYEQELAIYRNRPDIVLQQIFGKTNP